VSAFVDSSCYVAIALSEATAGAVHGALSTAGELWASPLLEAELRSALRREGVESEIEPLLDSLHWVLPERTLSVEIRSVLAAGYLRGGDAWHVANALFLAPGPDTAKLTFYTLDEPQRAVARKLGFRAPKLAR
jgi:uncharacterized protein with PIN domain